MVFGFLMIISIMFNDFKIKALVKKVLGENCRLNCIKPNNACFIIKRLLKVKEALFDITSTYVLAVWKGNHMLCTSVHSMLCHSFQRSIRAIKKINIVFFIIKSIIEN